jgi:hypothetical protein
MTTDQLKIVFVIVLCAPVAYFGIRFFMSLVNNAVAGRKVPERKTAKAVRGRPPGNNGRPGGGDGGGKRRPR